MADGSLVGVAIGGALAVVSSLGATWFSKFLETKYTARQLARAFEGELRALVQIVEKREYLRGLRSSVQSMKANGEPIYFSINAREEYRAVYKANSARLGLLKANLPTQIAVVYTQISAVLEDFGTLRDFSDNRNTSPIPVESLADWYTQAADMLEDTLTRGRETVQALQAHYPAN